MRFVDCIATVAEGFDVPKELRMLVGTRLQVATAATAIDSFFFLRTKIWDASTNKHPSVYLLRAQRPPVDVRAWLLNVTRQLGGWKINCRRVGE